LGVNKLDNATNHP